MKNHHKKCYYTDKIDFIALNHGFIYRITLDGIVIGKFRVNDDTNLTDVFKNYKLYDCLYNDAMNFERAETYILKFLK